MTERQQKQVPVELLERDKEWAHTLAAELAVRSRIPYDRALIAVSQAIDDMRKGRWSDRSGEIKSYI